jgi:tryptophan-rich sensory protein
MTHRSLGAQFLGLVGWLATSFAAASVGAIASANAGLFYGQLSQPTWAPPAWLFGPVWSVLYVFMAIAAWLVWRKHGFRGASGALWLFVTQLFANAMWTWLFFGLHRGGLALAEIAVLWLLIAASIFAFWRLQRFAALLLVPYLMWVSFASALTWSLWRMNPTLLG